MEISIQSIGEWLITLGSMALLVYVMAVVGERGTELVKAFLRLISKLPLLGKLEPHKWISWIAALVVAAGGVYGFEIDFFSEFDLFSKLDPDLLQVLSAAVVWIVSNYVHEKAALPTPQAG